MIHYEFAKWQPSDLIADKKKKIVGDIFIEKLDELIPE